MCPSLFLNNYNQADELAHFFASAGVLEADAQKPRSANGPDPVEQASTKRLAVGLREHAVALQAFCVKVYTYVRRVCACSEGLKYLCIL